MVIVQGKNVIELIKFCQARRGQEGADLNEMRPVPFEITFGPIKLQTPEHPFLRPPHFTLSASQILSSQDFRQVSTLQRDYSYIDWP